MPRLLIITTSYPEEHSASGKEAAGSFVADFAKELAHHTHTIVLAPGTTESGDGLANLRVHRFTVPKTPLSLLQVTNPAHWPAIWRTLRSGAEATEQLALQYQFDHVLALWALPAGYWARQLKRRHKIPYSVWALGSDIWSLGKIPIVRQVLRAVLRDSHACFADGHLLKKNVEQLAGRECHFLPSSRRLPPSQLKQLRGQPPYRLAFLGRWHRNKGTDLLLDSLALLDQDDWREIEEIRICGGGPLEPQVQERSTALAAAGCPVKLFGYLDKQQAADLLGWTDYVVIPSRIESVPVIFSDALQKGCPVISTPVGDLPRLIQQHHVGVLAEQVTARAIASAIRSAIRTSPQRFAAGIEEARAVFSLDAACEQFLRVADIALSPTKSPNAPVSVQS